MLSTGQALFQWILTMKLSFGVVILILQMVAETHSCYGTCSRSWWIPLAEPRSVLPQSQCSEFMYSSAHWLLKCDPRTIVIHWWDPHHMGTCQKCRISSSLLDLLHQNMHFNKMPRLLVCTIMFEMHYTQVRTKHFTSVIFSPRVHNFYFLVSCLQYGMLWTSVRCYSKCFHCSPNSHYSSLKEWNSNFV